MQLNIKNNVQQLLSIKVYIDSTLEEIELELPGTAFSMIKLSTDNNLLELGVFVI